MTKKDFRERLARAPAVLAPGVYDPLTALIAERAGFEALYLSGGAVAYTQFGRSDVGLTTATEAVNVLFRITDRTELPIIVDGDTGFGNAINVQRTVRDFERAGAAMIQLEDQTFPKRCGHLDDKTLVPTAEMCGKLKAALDARKSVDTLILARTDAAAVEGLDAAMERAEAYLACGVDALFIEAVRSPSEMDTVCGRFAPRSPGGTARFVAKQLEGYYTSLKQHGTTQPMKAGMFDFDELNGLIGTPELLAKGARYAR